MKSIFTLLSVPFLMAVSGCTPAEPSAESTPSTPTEIAAGTKPVVPSTAWIYRSENHGFSLELPSSDWKHNPKSKQVAEFWRRMNIGSPMMMGVSSVKQETEEQFRAFFPLMRGIVEAEHCLVEPTFQEGKTNSGNKFLSATTIEKGSSGSQFFYVVLSAVRLEDKKKTIYLIFEGQGKMQSKTFQSFEYEAFERAEKGIRLSVK